jgi:hypothetical protein
VFSLHFGNASTLHWEVRTAVFAGEFHAAIWPHRSRLYALVGQGADLSLLTIDTATAKIVARAPVEGPLLEVARSADGLVLLTGQDNTIAPVRLVVIGFDGSVRTIQLDRILAGTHIDEHSKDPLGTTNMPGLAVDPTAGVAYVVDGSGLAASVRLSDLSVTYHQLGTGSLLRRLAGWLVPVAQAKGANGPTLTAQWLGNGLLAVAGSEETGDVYAPTGLRIVDTRDWSVRMLDPRADIAWVGDGILLATGLQARYASYSHVHTEGLVAYGPDGSLRWRVTKVGDPPYVDGTVGSRAVLRGLPSLRLVNLATGHVIRTVELPSKTYFALTLLVGAGSAF